MIALMSIILLLQLFEIRHFGGGRVYAYSPTD